MYRPEYLTIEEIFGMYAKQDQPLNEQTISTILHPLEGTSFQRRAVDVFHESDEPVTAESLFVSFNGRLGRDIVEITDTRTPETAAMCLYQLSGVSVPMDCIYGVRWMEDDELLLREHRTDVLYNDADKGDRAGLHFAIQFCFFKGGVQRQVITLSQLGDTQTKEGNFIIQVYFTQLAEGILSHRYFRDVSRPPLPFLDPRQSSFERTIPLLCISPRFSLEKAQSKPLA